jgi:hypothetical protein
MSEDEWLTSTDPFAMLMAIQHLRLDPRLRRFAVECCRRVSHLIEGDVFRAAAAAGEAFADDPKNLKGTIPAMAEAMMRGCRARPGYAPKHERARFYANDAALATCGATGWSAAFNAARTAALAVAAGSDDVPSPEEQEWQAARLRSIVGNPFAPPRPID